ncbi:MAG: 30S ribosomal protein S8 [Chloroflexota bacterium]|jgi:small subunit ribosomal protein S8|nr:30S ribosomal protein S8 [Chloroflexota bacterium]
MSMTDPIADMLTRMRNAIERRHPIVEIPHSKIKESIAYILRDEGFVQTVEIVPDGDFRKIRVTLKYTEERRPVLTHLKRLSTPGRRLYTGANSIPRALGGMGVVIVSTPRGLLTGARARRENVGGELICEVW